MIAIGISNIFTTGVGIDSIRSEFHQAKSEMEIQAILDRSVSDFNSRDVNTIQAYKGAALSRMAEYRFSPFAKLKYFHDGTAMIEQSISKEKNVENVYLRLLIQLSVPRLLNYYENIESDFSYLIETLPDANLTMEYKMKMIQTISETNAEDIDLNRLKTIYFELYELRYGYSGQ